MGIQDRDYWKDRHNEQENSQQRGSGHSYQPPGKVYSDWGGSKPKSTPASRFYLFMLIFWLVCGALYGCWYALSFQCVKPLSKFVEWGICGMVFSM